MVNKTRLQDLTWKMKLILRLSAPGPLLPSYFCTSAGASGSFILVSPFCAQQGSFLYPIPLSLSLSLFQSFIPNPPCDPLPHHLCVHCLQQENPALLLSVTLQNQNVNTSILLLFRAKDLLACRCLNEKQKKKRKKRRGME